MVDADGTLVRVGLGEKLLVPVLAKLTSFVPGGGIWLNTQRPEWNDANNALAGPGLSMVTLYQLHRYLGFVADQLDQTEADTVALTSSVAAWFAGLLEVFEQMPAPTDEIDDRARRSILDTLGATGTEHRRRVGGGVDPSDGRCADRRRAAVVHTGG